MTPLFVHLAIDAVAFFSGFGVGSAYVAWGDTDPTNRLCLVAGIGIGSIAGIMFGGALFAYWLGGIRG